MPNNRYIFTVANLRHIKKIRYLRDMLPMGIELAQGNLRYLGRKVTVIHMFSKLPPNTSRLALVFGGFYKVNKNQSN